MAEPTRMVCIECGHVELAYTDDDELRIGLEACAGCGVWQWMQPWEPVADD